MPKKKKIQYDEKWICANCNGLEMTDHKQFSEHMLAVHGIDTKNAKGTRQMIMHLDGREFYTSVYHITVEADPLSKFLTACAPNALPTIS